MSSASEVWSLCMIEASYVAPVKSLYTWNISIAYVILLVGKFIGMLWESISISLQRQNKLLIWVLHSVEIVWGLVDIQMGWIKWGSAQLAIFHCPCNDTCFKNDRSRKWQSEQVLSNASCGLTYQPPYSKHFISSPCQKCLCCCLLLGL